MGRHCSIQRQCVGQSKASTNGSNVVVAAVDSMCATVYNRNPTRKCHYPLDDSTPCRFRKMATDIPISSSMVHSPFIDIDDPTYVFPCHEHKFTYPEQARTTFGVNASMLPCSCPPRSPTRRTPKTATTMAATSKSALPLQIFDLIYPLKGHPYGPTSSGESRSSFFVIAVATSTCCSYMTGAECAFFSFFFFHHCSIALFFARARRACWAQSLGLLDREPGKVPQV